ncbi:neuroblastoma-amplified sequence [Diachasma alloeum]|uniref:neuroblastoma-amplified sequence n=1 Tax=Diachasma alloeum TaxID=454923 RepID=UPI0007381D83|nr:neuroblastoma-amplified sequence [Diachasma alloeum]
MESNRDEIDDDSILYELLEYFVKVQDPELIKWKNDTAILSTPGTIKNALRYLNNRYSLPESISQQISLTLPWKFSIDPNGRLLALLLENSLEIRKSKDEFSSVISKATVPKDAFPQWRKLSWSPDASLLVLASSNGSLSFYNSLGNNIFTITPRTVSQSPDILEAGDAISSLMFKPPREDKEKWSYEFLVVTYSGLLKSYSISGTHGFKHNYEFSFGNFFRKGVNAFAYSEKHNLYIVAGNCITQSHLASPAASSGLTSWRPLNDYPFYKLSFTFEENSTSTLSLWSLIPSFRTPPAPVIFRISISPGCSHLVCLHTDGAVSLWDLPSLKLRKKWSLPDQPGYDAQNPLPPKRLRRSPTTSDFHPVDIGWWSDHSIIIARYSGAVSVCSMSSLSNLLGASPEFLSGQPQISEFYSGKGFLALDCETLVTSKKRKRTPSHDGSPSDAEESDQEEDELEPITLLDYSINLLKSLIYSITDIERFQPKRKKSKILQRTYRLLGLKSTTPEELYARKIDIEEYEDALSLANTYNLDKDLVHQTRWRKSEFSLAAINDHLSKVSKRSWVLNECISRVPDTLEAARELLNFGLRGANLETFLSISTHDDGKLMDEKVNEELAELNRGPNSLKQVQKINDLLKGMKEGLTEPQKELIGYRRQLLDHLDKLKTYEILIGEGFKYRKEFYEKFRRLSLLENAVKFARDCDYRAVEIMFTYHGGKLMPHWLAIISCFPETLSPGEYEKLLPECDSEGQLYLLYQKELRTRDWSEKSQFEGIASGESTGDSETIYEDDPSLAPYRTTELTMNLLTKWYKSRANQIERDSCIVENALELIKIGKSHRIDGLEDLLVELETLNDLIYKIYLEDMSLAQLEKLSNLQKLQLLMSRTTEESFINDITSFLLPFLYRRQEHLDVALEKHLFREYLVELSQADLTFPSILFHNLGQDPRIVEVIDDVMTLALGCIHSCVSPDMYEKARDIFDAVSKNFSIKDSSRSENPLDDLGKELECLKILNKYHVSSTIRFISENKENPEPVRVLLNEMASSLKERSPAPPQEAWTELLNDILEVQGLVFNCIETEICFEIVASTKLSSGVKANIQDCVSLIETRRKEGSFLKISYPRAIELVVEAARRYFDSSKSLHDPTMELAKACLNLIDEDDKVVQREFDLINALQVLDEFSLNILPLQVRNCPNKLKLIENCLDTCEGAYKRQQRLLTLSSYLHLDTHNQKHREGKILSLIATKSFQVEDFATCASTCKQLIDSSYSPAWGIIHKLASCQSYPDLEFKKRCFWFTITHGPPDILEDSLRQVHLLEIQLLNKNLETWMSSHAYDDLATDPDEDSDPDDDFADAITTPQVESREFVPKILETSTGIVKNSAQIFNQSLGILRSVSNQGFWRAALNINRKNVFEDTYDVDEDATLEKYRGILQSFPFFYQSLHENCLVSRIDTRYSKYSQPDVDNTKLKMCQTLVRVALLSETASYGLEISDIRHFFVQCCSHVMNDDWTLGFSYLLACGGDVEEVMRGLKRSELHVQGIIYFYGVQMFRGMFPGDERYLLYDPMEVVRGMVEQAWGGDDEVKKAIVYWVDKLREEEVEEVNGGESIGEQTVEQARGGDDEAKKAIVDWVDKLREEEVEEVNGGESIGKQTELEKEANDLGGGTFKVVDDVEGDWGDDAWGDDFSAEVEEEEIEGNEEWKEVGNLGESGSAEGDEAGGAWGDAEFNDDDIVVDLEEVKDEVEDDEIDKVILDGEKENCEGFKRLEEKKCGKIEDNGEGWGDESGWGDDWPEDGETAGAVDEGETKIKGEVGEIREEKMEVSEEKGEVDEKKVTEKIDSAELSEGQEWGEEGAGWDSWGDFPEVEEDGIVGEKSSGGDFPTAREDDIPIVDDSTEEERFQIFEDLFTNMESKNDYEMVKEVLKRWPQFQEPEFVCVDKNPVLLMIERVSWVFGGKGQSKGESIVLEEYRDLLRGQLIPEEVLHQFIEKSDEKSSLEEKIFLRLSSNIPELHEEAVDLMKSSNLSEFPLPILEEAFFKNLTPSFPPHHPIYDKILEQMFLNHDLPELEPNMRILIKKLMEQKHIPYAVALWNQLAGVPPALTTFESCFQLLMKE